MDVPTKREIPTLHAYENILGLSRWYELGFKASYCRYEVENYRLPPPRDAPLLPAPLYPPPLRPAPWYDPLREPAADWWDAEDAPGDLADACDREAEPDACPPEGWVEVVDLFVAPEPAPPVGLFAGDPEAVPERSGVDPDGRVDAVPPPAVLPRL
jgi:hypothetical protein